MPILTLETEPLAIGISFSEDVFRVVLDDGRTLSVPLAWSPPLLRGTTQQREHWEPIVLGEGIHWPDLDEDISVAGILAGPGDQTKARRTAA